MNRIPKSVTCTSNAKERISFLAMAYTTLANDNGFWETAEGAAAIQRLGLESPPTESSALTKSALTLASDAFREPKVYYLPPSWRSRIPVEALHLNVLQLDSLKAALEEGAEKVDEYLCSCLTEESLPFAFVNEPSLVLDKDFLAALHASFQQIGRLNGLKAASLWAKGIPASSRRVPLRGESSFQMDSRFMAIAMVMSVGFDYESSRNTMLSVNRFIVQNPSAVGKRLEGCPEEAMKSIVQYYEDDMSLRIMTGDINDSHLNATALLLKELNIANFSVDDRGVIGHKSFYNNTALDFEGDDMKQDFIRYLKSKESPEIFSFCRYPFLIDANFKNTMMQLEAMVENQGAMRDTMLSSMFSNGRVGAENHFLILNIDRNDLITSTLRGIERNSRALTKPLRVKFIGEDGIDEGGLRKEFFQLLCKEILDPNYGMFKQTENNSLWLVPDVQNSNCRREFRMIGQILGIAVYNNVMLDVNFPQALFRRLLDRRVDVGDLEEIDPTFVQGLNELLSFEEEDGMTVEDIFCRTFVYEHEVFGEQIEVELVPGGSSMNLTAANRNKFVDSMVEYVMRKSIEGNFSAFREGFRSVCNRPLMENMDPDELRLLICGSSLLDFDELEESTHYDGYDAKDDVIKNFWDILKNDFDTEKKREFLKFCTGSDKVPIRGLRDLNFVIGKNGGDGDMLPTAHTCFNHLLLPQYETREKLREKLLLAIQNCQGFGLK